MENKGVIFVGAVIFIIVVVIGLNSVLNNKVKLTGETKEFEITAKYWEFTPSRIEVNKGDKVTLKLKSIEGVHGFLLSDFGVNMVLRQGEEVEVEFIADKTGEFSFFCNIPCGQGHSGMNGMFIVR